MSASLPRIAIVDDHPILCEGFESRIKKWGKGEIALLANSANEYFTNALERAPIDIAIVDRSMPAQDGFAVLEWIRINQPETKPIMMSFDYGRGDVRKALGLGARATMRKNRPTDEILRVLESVLLTGYYTDDFTQKELLESGKIPKLENAKIIESLTRKETEVLKHLCDPDTPTYKEIGERLGIKESTVHTYRKRLFGKFGIRSKIGLFKFVADWGIFKH